MGISEREFQHGLYDVAMRRVPNMSHVSIYGENLDLDLGVEEDIWDSGGLYTFTDAYNPVNYYISSTSALDTQTISIHGLCDNCLIRNQQVTLNGQNKVRIGSADTLYTRFNWAINYSIDSLNGDVYIYEDDTVVLGVPQTPTKIRGKIIAKNNQTEMGIYSVPLGKYACLDAWDASINSLVTANVTLYIWVKSIYSNAWLLKRTLVLRANGTSSFMQTFGIPYTLPEGFDLRISAISDTNNISVGVGYKLMLVDYTELSDKAKAIE